MKAFSRAMVHGVLAAHLGLAQKAIDPTQRLDRDLGLDRLDLVFVGLRLEERADDGAGDRCGFPLDALEPEMTVRELVAVFESWWRGDELPEEDLAPDTLRSSVTPPLSGRDADQRDSFA